MKQVALKDQLILKNIYKDKSIMLKNTKKEIPTEDRIKIINNFLLYLNI